jgi:hypothetical protein
MLVFLTILAFLSRTVITVTAIPSYVVHMVHSLFRLRFTTHYIAGTVIDGTSRKPIPLAEVTIWDSSTNAVLATLRTDRSDHYFLSVKRDGAYAIQVIKRGYELLEPIAYRPDLSPYHIIHVLYVNHVHRHHLLHHAAWITMTVFGFLFEALLLLSAIFELLFMEYFGFGKTLPFFTVTLVNILLWWMYIHHSRQHTIE